MEFCKPNVNRGFVFALRKPCQGLKRAHYMFGNVPEMYAMTDEGNLKYFLKTVDLSNTCDAEDTRLSSPSPSSFICYAFALVGTMLLCSKYEHI